MRRFTLKPNLMIIIALLAACLVLTACGDSQAENPQSERTGVVNVESREFVNEQLLAENPLFIPPLLEPRLENGEKVFDLAVQAGETEFFEGKWTETSGFNGNYLGPTLPDEYGVDDIPLVVQDRQFDDQAQLIYRHEQRALTAGMLGDTILVNGTRAPYVEAPAKLIRLRLLNGSNARRYNFGFSDNRVFYQIASDGGLLEAPVERTRLLLAPAERAEILVDLSASQEPVMLMSYAFADSESAIANSIQETLLGGTDQGQQFKILELRPQPGTFAAQEIPQTLNTIQRLDEADAARTRQFTLEAFTINGKLMDHSRIDEIVRKGDIEIWELYNNSPSYHPFHIHGVQFLVLDRDGKAPPAYEQGWKDTVIVGREETVRVIMQFKDYSDPNLPYMFHCHILEHEDMGMMGQFVVVDDPSEDVQIQSPLMGLAESHHQHH